MLQMSQPSYLIVGSGVFGASTALCLIRKYPDANITLIDREAYTAPARVAASWDWNKVIRADYRDIFYTKLALEAQHLWRTDEIWRPFYHESGVVWISPTSFAEQAQKNFAELGVSAGLRTYPVDQARPLFENLFADADYTGVKEVLVNHNSGWAEAKEALQRTIKTAVGLGVKYITAEVAAVIFEETCERHKCCGVKTRNGDTVSADRVILCTGAYTPKLLVHSAPEWTDLHAGERIIAAGVTEAIAPFDFHKSLLRGTMPVGINANPTELGSNHLYILSR